MSIFKNSGHLVLSRYMAYSIVFFTFGIIVVMPVVFRYETSYAAPTAVYATQILSGDGAVKSLGGWADAIEAEFFYPVPSMLLSVLVLLTDIPKEYTMFTPIAALASLSYFVLARRILRWTPSNHGLLLSAVFYAYVVLFGFKLGPAQQISRASLGQAFFNFFLLVYVLYLSKREGSPSGGWLVVSVIFTLAIGLSYYTSTLAIALFCLFMVVVYPVVVRSIRQPRRFPALPIAILAFFLFIYNTYVISTIGEAAAMGGAFVANIITRILTVLGIQQAGALRTDVMLGVDPVTIATGTWVYNATTYVSMGALLYVLLLYRPQRQRKIAKIWLFSLAVFLTNLSDFAYLFFVVASPVRILTRYGLIVLFYILAQRRGQANHQGHEVLGKHLALSKTIVVAIVLIMVLLGSLGAMRFAWYYGSGKPYAYQRIEPLSHVLLVHSSSRDPITLMGDAYYTANIFYVAALEGKIENVIPYTMGEDAVTLYNSMHSNETSDLLESMRTRDIKCLLLTPGSMWGDEWGYAVTLPSTSFLDHTTSTSLLYDGPAQLFCDIGS